MHEQDQGLLYLPQCRDQPMIPGRQEVQGLSFGQTSLMYAFTQIVLWVTAYSIICFVVGSLKSRLPRFGGSGAFVVAEQKASPTHSIALIKGAQTPGYAFGKYILLQRVKQEARVDVLLTAFMHSS